MTTEMLLLLLPNNNNNNNDDPVCAIEIELSCNTVILFAAGFLMGILSSIVTLKCYPTFRSNQQQQPLLSIQKPESIHLVNDSPTDDDDDDDDGSLQVLHGSLSLIEKYTSVEERKRRKVVEFLSPEQVLSKFQKNSSDEEDDSLSLDVQVKGVDQFLKLLQQIQQYSVDTSHKFFFNQLFGTVDPVAMAAELIATCCNTCVYTFETAPIFTMMERHLIQKMIQLVYHNKHDNDDVDDVVDGFGLFLPGGSISNMTALHVARYYILNQHPKQQPQSQDSFIQDTTTTTTNNNNNNNRKRLHQELDEEKKIEDQSHHHHHHNVSSNEEILSSQDIYDMQNRFVAFVSDEAHYSFVKSMNVIGFHPKENLVLVPTLENGQMDVVELEKAIHHVSNVERKIPFFVGITAGSTVRGSFDDISAIVNLCRSKHIWIHVDGAWGGAALFSSQYRDLLLKDIHHVDSFTFNPHKLLGAPQQTTIFLTKHKNALVNSNATGAKYLFDKRKIGAEYDLGDASYTCGRRTDAMKFWAMWKYYGVEGLQQRIEYKVDILAKLAHRIRQHPAFLLIDEWPFNINFFYLPKRLRVQLTDVVPLDEVNPKLPDEIYKDLADISVKLKLRLHQSGEMLIPFQPLNGVNADCFRVVLAGKKDFTDEDNQKVLDLMHLYGDDL